MVKLRLLGLILETYANEVEKDGFSEYKVKHTKITTSTLRANWQTGKLQH